MKKISLILGLLFLVNICSGEDSLVLRFTKKSGMKICIWGGDFSAIGTMSSNPCAMEILTVSVVGSQMFCYGAGLLSDEKNKITDKQWFKYAKYLGYARTLLCLSYTIYGMNEAQGINTRTSAIWYGLTIPFNL